jgi:hypothetical protein
MKEKNNYSIRGTVTRERDRHGVQNLGVEAWDKNMLIHNSVGKETEVKIGNRRDKRANSNRSLVSRMSVLNTMADNMKHMKFIHSIPILLVLLILYGCGNSSKDNHKNKGDESTKPSSFAVQKLTKKQAVQSVQNHIYRTKKTVMVQTHYYERITRKKPCTQYDIDLGRNCSGRTASAPYGYRKVTEQVRKCCRPTKKMVYSIKGRWIATYSKSSGNWSVEFEFSDDNKSKNKLKWLINDKSKKITAEN